MNDLLIPLLSAAAIVGYWVVCRRRSLSYRQKAADLLVEYFGKHNVSDEDKDAAERFYKIARFWFFMPLMTILAFPVLLVRVLAKKPEPQATKERVAITEMAMKMYLVRNPITGAVCLAAFFFSGVLALFVGLLINRVRSMPTPVSFYASTARAFPLWRHHVHR